MKPQLPSTKHVGVIFIQGASSRWFDSIPTAKNALGREFPQGIKENEPKHTQVVDEHAPELERTLIGRLVSQFQQQQFDRVIIVTGQHEGAVRNWYEINREQIRIPVSWVGHPSAEDWQQTLPLVAQALTPDEIAVGVGGERVLQSKDLAKIKRRVRSSPKPVLAFMYGRRQGSKWSFLAKVRGKRRFVKPPSAAATWIFNRSMVELIASHGASPTSRKSMISLGWKLLRSLKIPWEFLPKIMRGSEVINVDDVMALKRAREYISEQRSKGKWRL